MSNAFIATPRKSPDACGWTIRRVVLHPQRRAPGAVRPLFEPPTDVYETLDRMVVRVEIAGLTPEALEVALNAEGTALTVSGRRDDPAAGCQRKYYSMEIECGDFARQVAIPQPIDLEAVSAAYHDGFLEIVLPKVAPAAPRTRSVPIQ